jgi:bis(5'-adenosyl)-triphosphatase
VLEQAEVELGDVTEQAKKGYERLRMDAEEARKPRSMEEMESEAKWLSAFFEHTLEDPST